MLNNPGKHLIFLFIVSLIMLVSNLGILPVNIMEARNFITAREMVQDNHWILTTMNGEPRYEKPPLPTWITAVFGSILGFDSNLSLRLPVAFITILLVVYLYKFSLKLGLSGLNSLQNGLIAITSFYIYFAGRDNQWDMYCHSFMIVSIYYLWEILRIRKNPFKNAVIGAVFLAFSILSKGPISLYALLLPFLIAYGWVYRYSFRNERKHILAILLYTILGIFTGISWTTYVHWADPETFASMAKVETSRWVNDYNSKSVFYYWSFFTQSGIWTLAAFLGLLYPYMKSRVSNIKAYQFTLIWTLASVILLSIIPEKKTRYLLPVLIPLALNTGFYINYLTCGTKKKIDRILGNISLGLVGIVGIVYPAVLYFFFKDSIYSQKVWVIMSSVAMFISGVLICYYLTKTIFDKAFYMVVVVQCVVIAFIFPLSKSFLHNSNYKSVEDLKRVLNKNIELYTFNSMTPEIVWEYGKKMPVINEYELAEKLENESGQPIGILCIKGDSESLMKKFSSKYEIKNLSYVDLNTVSPGSEDYRDRLHRELFILYRK